jgi:hypothetical protein
MAKSVAEGVKEEGGEPILKRVEETDVEDLRNYCGCCT